jgi:hypothetical protein
VKPTKKPKIIMTSMGQESFQMPLQIFPVVTSMIRSLNIAVYLMRECIFSMNIKTQTKEIEALRSELRESAIHKE